MNVTNKDSEKYVGKSIKKKNTALNIVLGMLYYIKK